MNQMNNLFMTNDGGGDNNFQNNIINVPKKNIFKNVTDSKWVMSFVYGITVSQILKIFFEKIE